MSDPDAHCLECGRPITFTRNAGRVYRRKTCSTACRKARFRNKNKSNPLPRKLPPPPLIPPEETEKTLTVSIQSYTQAQILAYLETCRLPNNVKMDIWNDWKQGQIPSEPPKKDIKEVHDDDNPLPEHEQVEAIRTVAVALTKLIEKANARKSSPRVLRDRIPEGGDST